MPERLHFNPESGQVHGFGVVLATIFLTSEFKRVDDSDDSWDAEGMSWWILSESQLFSVGHCQFFVPLSTHFYCHSVSCCLIYCMT